MTYMIRLIAKYMLHYDYRKLMTSYTIIFDNVHLISYLWPLCENLDFEIQLYSKFIHNITVCCLTKQYHVIDKTTNTRYAFSHKYICCVINVCKKDKVHHKQAIYCINCAFQYVFWLWLRLSFNALLASELDISKTPNNESDSRNIDNMIPATS